MSGGNAAIKWVSSEYKVASALDHLTGRGSPWTDLESAEVRTRCQGRRPRVHERASGQPDNIDNISPITSAPLYRLSRKCTTFRTTLRRELYSFHCFCLVLGEAAIKKQNSQE